MVGSVKVSSERMVSYWSVAIKRGVTGSSMLKPGPGGFSGLHKSVSLGGVRNGYLAVSGSQRGEGPVPEG